MRKYLISFGIGFALSVILASVGVYFIIGANKAAYAKLETELATSRTEIDRLGKLVIRSDDIVRRETEIIRQERAIANREADNNRRAKEIYSDLRDIVSGSYSDLDALDRLAELVSRLE